VTPRHGFPVARSEDLITEEVGEEIVAYDERSKEAHCLGPLAAIVFAGCDGRTSVADLAGIASAQLDESVDVGRVEQALVELEERDLLVVTAPQPAGLSRRQMLRRTAVLSGAAMSVPLVTSITTPAYGAGSPVGEPTSLSHLSAVFDCTKNGTTTRYKVKWEFNQPVGVFSECGNFSGDCPSLNVPGAPSGAACDPVSGFTAVEDNSGQVTITWSDDPNSAAGDCTLVHYELKCGQMPASGDTDNDGCVDPGEFGNPAVPDTTSTAVLEGCPI
jgi:hypothetical protein